MQAFGSILALGLAATVAALPNGLLSSRHLGGLDARTVDPLGTCGGSTGYVCADGQCCSQYGYCGTGTDYCGSGTATTTASSGTATTAAASSSTSTSSSSSSGDSSGQTSATCTSRASYSGDGSTSAGWPDESTWVTFDTLWSLNEDTISSSCTQFSQTNNSDDETAELKSAIQSVASSSGVDERFILAVVMQESKGCVRVWSTANAVTNPGLMQDHDGSNSCYNVDPCPESTIIGMIEDGTTGTSSGDGLQQILASLSTTGSQQVYQAARIYNSGSIPSDGDLSTGGATNSYASDIADRLGGCVF